MTIRLRGWPVEFSVQESTDKRIWSTVKTVRSLRECYMELVGFEESFPVQASRTTFEWNLNDGKETYYYRILKRGSIVMREDRFDPRTCLPRKK